MEPLSAAELRAALTDVAGRLERAGTQARLYLAGGGAMALAYDADRLTRDLDVAVEGSHGDLFAAVRAVARERGWPATWLNEQATSYLPPTDDAHSTVVFDHPGLVVAAASPRHLLAMKTVAARESDRLDVVDLLRRCGSPSVTDVDDLVADVYDGERLNERQRRWIEDIITTLPYPDINL